MSRMMIEPDTKDWTWVLERPCPECGFDAPNLDRDRIPQAIRDNATLWDVVLDTDEATTNPPITLEQMISNAGSIDSVRQSGRQITVRFREEFDAQAALGVDSRTFEATLDDGVNVSDVFRFANVPVGDDGVRVISE